MSIELRVPEVGESITEVHIGPWRKRPGESVRKDEPVVEIESDKATVDLPSPMDGIIDRVVKQQGETAQVGEVIAYLRDADGAPAKSAAPAEQPATKAETEVAVRKVHGQTVIGDVQPKTDKSIAPTERPRNMPAAERLLAEENVAAESVTPSGPGGRILKEDVQRQVESRAVKQPPPIQVSAEPAEPTELQLPPNSSAQLAREEEFVVMSPIRRRIAQRLVEAQQTAALLTTFNEIDMSQVIALRAKYKDNYEDRYGIKLGFMSFFVKATVDALKQFPQVNAEVRDPHIVYRNYYDIGIAVGGGKGLVVPVLRHAEFMSFAQIEQTIADFARRAKDNKLRLEELQGGTFTISNGGVYGSLLSTPIINPPQSGILGLHAIQDRPVAHNGQVVIRPMMYVALTYDHRIVDGREAVTFLKRIKEAIEDPSRMLLEV